MQRMNINTNYIFDKIISSLSRTKTDYFSKTENDYEYNFRKKKEQHEIDSILDKISDSGYESLSSQEKEKLFNQKVLLYVK